MDLNKLTNDQKKAYQDFITFLLDDSQMNLIIQGSAGTGKSFLLKYLIKDGIKNYVATCKALNQEQKYTKFAVTATTNKAVEALSGQSLLDQEKKGIVTTASFLGLRVAYDPKLHKQHLIPNNYDSAVIEHAIIFIDECSMINSELFQYIQERCKNCKIIYIGDKYQLPPVKEKISPIYNAGYPEIVLNEPVRNAGNQALIDLCTQLKNTCETGEWKDIHSVSGSIEVIKDSNVWQSIIDGSFLRPDAEKKILAYSNNLVTSYVEYIMQLRGESEYLAEGSWYTSNNFYKLSHSYGISSLPVDSPLLIKQVKKDVPDYLYSYYHLDKDNPAENDLLREIRVYSPLLQATWSAFTFARPELYQKYTKLLYKANPKRYYDVSQNTLDLRKAESSTVHKAQGSTLDTVYIDLDDISKCTQKDLTAKLLYVAVSRAKSKVVFFGDLAKRYGVTVS